MTCFPIPRRRLSHLNHSISIVWRNLTLPHYRHQKLFTKWTSQHLLHQPSKNVSVISMYVALSSAQKRKPEKDTPDDRRRIRDVTENISDRTTLTCREVTRLLPIESINHRRAKVACQADQLTLTAHEYGSELPARSRRCASSLVSACDRAFSLGRAWRRACRTLSCIVAPISLSICLSLRLYQSISPPFPRNC